MLNFFRIESAAMASEYSPSDVLERLYQNQLALEAAVMELKLWLSSKTLQRRVRMFEARLARLVKMQAI